MKVNVKVTSVKARSFHGFKDGVPVIKDETIILKNLKNDNEDSVMKALTREIGKTAVGKMEIQGYTTEKKSYDIPDDVLAQYEIK